MKLCIVAHPELESFVFGSKEQARKFVKSNMDVWADKNVDYRAFTTEEATLADQGLIQAIKESRPELFL